MTQRTLRELVSGLLEKSFNLDTAVQTHAFEIGARLLAASAVTSPNVRAKSLAERALKLEILEKKHRILTEIRLVVAVPDVVAFCSVRQLDFKI